MSKKQPNQLAQLIDHQIFAGSALPQNLADNMRLYIDATDEIKELLVDCLPEEILTSCWVVGLTSEQLTVSVISITAANHIRYLQKAYLKVLTEYSSTFKQLKKIHVVVVKSPKNYDSKNLYSSVKTTSELSRIDNNKGLSQNTKRTISQAIEHVTTDENLKKALLRLLN